MGEENRRSQEVELKMRRFGGLGFGVVLGVGLIGEASSSSKVEVLDWTLC